MKNYTITKETLRAVGYGKCYLDRLENKDHDPAIKEFYESEYKVLRKIGDGSTNQ